MQLPLDIAPFLDAADSLVSGQGYKTVVSVGSPSGGLGSAAMRKPLERVVRQEGWSRARRCHTIGPSGIAITAPVSSRWDCGMARIARSDSLFCFVHLLSACTETHQASAGEEL